MSDAAREEVQNALDQDRSSKLRFSDLQNAFPSKSDKIGFFKNLILQRKGIGFVAQMVDWLQFNRIQYEDKPGVGSSIKDLMTSLESVATDYVRSVKKVMFVRGFIPRTQATGIPYGYMKELVQGQPWTLTRLRIVLLHLMCITAIQVTPDEYSVNQAFVAQLNAKAEDDSNTIGFHAANNKLGYLTVDNAIIENGKHIESNDLFGETDLEHYQETFVVMEELSRSVVFIERLVRMQSDADKAFIAIKIARWNYILKRILDTNVPLFRGASFTHILDNMAIEKYTK